MSVLNNFLLRLWQKSKIGSFLGLSILWGLLGEISYPLTAQVIPDNTLPNNSTVTSEEGITEITGGTLAGENLFHSFEQFSILTGNTVFFNNADNIANIISRVTGGSISDINGLLRANGTANLFLINPNGIVFGENAALNIGGSFIGSTADSLQFADGSEFSAADPQAPPLLTVNIPVGLQYGADAGEIKVTGLGNNLSIDPDSFAIVRENRPEGLRVQPGKTLSLIGGKIFLEGGNLTAEGGNIKVGSVGSNKLVSFTPVELGWQFNYEGIENFQDISLSQASSIDASGNGGGNIQLQGRRIQVKDGSAILANTLGDSAGGNLTVKATEGVEIIGTTVDNSFFSGLFADVASGASGNGGNLTINTERLLINQGAQVGVNTFGNGDAGTLTVQATEVELVGDSPLGGSGLFSNVETDVMGNGGNLTVDTQLLKITNGAQIAAITFGVGDAGVLNVAANEIKLIGESVDGFPSGLLSNVEEGASGDGGNLNVNTNILSISDGAQVNSITLGEGDAGKINIQASQIKLIGDSPLRPSNLSTSVELGASGIGGSLTIESDLLQLTEGAQISVGTFGEGNAGALIIKTQNLEIIGSSQFGSSGLFSPVDIEATGKGGNLTIDTGNLLVTGGGQIAASTAGAGDGGELVINATESIELIGSSAEGASGLFANAIFDTGNGGDIKVNTPRLSIENGATINASNFSSRDPDVPPGKGRAGNITINADSLVLDSTTASELSSITAATFEAGGGNINLNIRDSLTANSNSQITAETRGSSDGGEISIETGFLGLTNRGRISANSSGTGDASNINIDTNRLETDGGIITATADSSGGGDIDIEGNFISLDNQSVLSTSVANSSGGGGDISINSDFFIVSNNSEISANAVLGAGGNIDIATQGLFLDGDSQITASSEFGIDGEVNIETTENRNGIVRLPELIRDQSEQITTGCAVNRGNLFVSIGKGGIPENPSDYLAGETFWTDLRPLNRQIPKNTKRNYQSGEMPTPIVEAQNWIVNDRGQVQLIADASAQTPWKNTFECK